RLPEGEVQPRAARPYPGQRTGVVVAVARRVDVDAPDHFARRRIEHRVREPLPVAELVRMALVQRHLSRPAAVAPSGRRGDVVHRRRPGVVVLLVVFGSQRLEDELRRLEPARYVEVARDELVHRPIVARRRVPEPGTPGTPGCAGY